MLLTIATPEHWHAPMAKFGNMQAGKHVFIEKLVSHNL